MYVDSHAHLEMEQFNADRPAMLQRAKDAGVESILAIGSGTGPELKYFGGSVVVGQFAPWVPIGAEQTASGYEFAWKAGSDNYTVWSTDSSGNYLTNLTGIVSGSSNALEALLHDNT